MVCQRCSTTVGTGTSFGAILAALPRGYACSCRALVVLKDGRYEIRGVMVLWTP